jgi:hypothetical protein
VLRIRDVYPGFRIRLFSIPDPGSELSPSRIPDPGSSSKNLSILTPKKAKIWFQALKNMIWVVHPGSRFRMLTFFHPGSRIQGSKRHPIPDPGSGSATLIVKETLTFPLVANTICGHLFCFFLSFFCHICVVRINSSGSGSYSFL